MRVAVIGAGSWGTAIAALLAQKVDEVRLWAHSESTAEHINAHHVNPRYLTDATLPSNIEASSSFEFCLEGVSAVAVVTPSQTLRETAQSMKPYCPKDAYVVICSKGVESNTGILPIDMFEEELGNPDRLAVLSGPNHAEEVIKGIPSATVIASRNEETACALQQLFATDTFRTYTSTDVVGVEICAAAKNVIAIATGISYGLGFGDNTAATLMTRGLAEMSRLVESCGGQALTCMGLAGMGDLIVTCSSRHSRNRRLGELIADGGTLDDFIEQTHMVAEGAYASQTLAPLAERGNVELPIADVVRSIVWEGANPHTAVEDLFKRPLKQEFYGISIA